MCEVYYRSSRSQLRNGAPVGFGWQWKRLSRAPTDSAQKSKRSCKPKFKPKPKFKLRKVRKPKFKPKCKPKFKPLPKSPYSTYSYVYAPFTIRTLC